MSTTPVVLRRTPSFTSKAETGAGDSKGVGPPLRPPPHPPRSRTPSGSSSAPTPPLPPSPEHFKTFVIAIIFVISYNFNLFCTTIAHELHPDDETNQPLPDVILSFTEPRPWAFEYSEFCVLFNVFCGVLLVLAHSSRWLLLRRAVFIYTLINIYRAFTVMATILPNSVRGLDCAPRSSPPSPSAIFAAFWRVTSACGFRIAGEPRTCGDWIFSGHTASMVWANLIVAEYAPKSVHRLLSVSVTLSSVVGTSLVLASHDHYTIDCIIAYFVTTRVFWTYHSLLVRKFESPFSRFGGGGGGVGGGGVDDPLRRVWWSRAFDFIEEKNLTPTENKFVWNVERKEKSANGDVRKML